MQTFTITNIDVVKTIKVLELLNVLRVIGDMEGRKHQNLEFKVWCCQEWQMMST